MTTLATAKDLATLLGLPEGDPALSLALRRASDAFAGAVGYPVVETIDDTVLIASTGGETIALPARPVSAASVLMHPDEDPVTASVAPGAPVVLDTRLGTLHRAGGWPRGLMLVTYSHGYKAGKIPGDIQDVVLERAAHIAEDLGALASVSTGPFSESYAPGVTGGVTQKWADTVARYMVGLGDRS